MSATPGIPNIPTIRALRGFIGSITTPKTLSNIKTTAPATVFIINRRKPFVLSENTTPNRTMSPIPIKKDKIISK